MVIMDEPTFAGCLITARPIGILDMVDCGAHDGKLLCVPVADPRQRTIHSIRQIAPNQLEEVAEFFRTYKNLEGRVIEINGWLDSDGHCSNIMNPGFTEIGVGFHDYYWTQNFGTPR